MKTIYLILLFLVICVFSGFAQTRTVVGTTTDDKTLEPLPYVSIWLKDHSVGATTDINGKFIIVLPAREDTLEVIYVGYEKTFVVLPLGKDTVSISLNESPVSLMSLDVKEETLSYTDVMDSGSKKYTKDSDASEVYFSAPAFAGDYEGSATSYSMNNSIAAGQLTAGEVNDFQKWKLWGDITESELKSYRNVWGLFPKNRYLFQLENKFKMPVVDAQVILSDGEGNAIWKACTDNTGKAELWMSLFEENAVVKDLSIEVLFQGKKYYYNNVTAFQDGVNVLEIPVDCVEQKNVDIAFVVDATGSMSDELEYLKVELTDVISRVKDSLPWAKVRLATVFYRDLGDAYVTKLNDFTDNIDDAVAFIKLQSAGGGGDFPEAVDSALSIALNKLSWSSEAASRLIFMVLDAPPHSEKPQVIESLKKVIPGMAEKGIRVIPVACSGIEKSTEYFLRSLALATNGTYVFLTDDSGIGYSHIKPSTDKYDVELLNDALIRIISSFSKMEECRPPVAENFDTTKTDTAFVNMPPVDSLTAAANDTLGNDTASRTSVQPELAFSWKYYPNPTNGILNIEIINLPANSEGEIYLTDITGKVLKRFTVDESRSILIDISEFPTGTYLLRVLYDKDKWLTGKVILLH